MIRGDVGGASGCEPEWGGDGSAVGLLLNPATRVDGIDRYQLSEHRHLVNPVASCPCGNVMEREVGAVEGKGGRRVLEQLRVFAPGHEPVVRTAERKQFNESAEECGLTVLFRLVSGHNWKETSEEGLGPDVLNIKKIQLTLLDTK